MTATTPTADRGEWCYHAAMAVLPHLERHALHQHVLHQPLIDLAVDVAVATRPVHAGEVADWIRAQRPESSELVEDFQARLLAEMAEHFGVFS